MAAPWKAWRVFQAQRCILQSLDFHLQPAAVWSCQVQQARHKKGLRRAKQPHVPVQKAAYIGKQKQKIVTEKVYPKGWFERVPVDDVWIRKYYPDPELTLAEAVKRHKEYAQPAISDNPNGLITVTFDLDLRTKKKTKFISHIKKTIPIPRNFDDGTLSRVIAFCSDSEKQAAIDAGAIHAGSSEIMKMMMSGELQTDDYEHVVCTGEMITQITPIKKFLRDRFPSKVAGTMGPDIVGMVQSFATGKTYELKKLKEDLGTVKVAIGRVSMASEHIEENFKAYIEALALHRSADLGPFITKAIVECPPSPEVFLLNKEETLPASQKGKKVHKLEQEEEPAAAESDDEGEAVEAKAKQQ